MKANSAVQRLDYTQKGIWFFEFRKTNGLRHFSEYLEAFESTLGTTYLFPVIDYVGFTFA